MNNVPAKIILFPQKTKRGYPLKIRISVNKPGSHSKTYHYIGLNFFLAKNQKDRYWSAYSC